MQAIKQAIDEVGGPARLAVLLGVTTQAVCFWRDGKRQMPVQHCSTIELATDGQVTRRDLRPNDWQRIWPELATTSASAAGEG